MHVRVIPLLAVLVAAVPAGSAGAAAPTPITYRQQANAVCQDFYAHVPALSAPIRRAGESWRHARRQAAVRMRRIATASLAADRRLAAVPHPGRLDARWRRLVAIDRSGARILLRVARRVEHARSAIDGSVAFTRGLLHGYDPVGTRFRRLARALRLAGRVRLDPSVDLGRDLSATAQDRAAAAALGRAGLRIGQRIRADRRVIIRRVRALLFHGPCARVYGAVDRAPKRAQERVNDILGLAFMRAAIGPIRRPLLAFAAAARRVHTADPPLASGRTVLVAMARGYARLAEAPNRCAAVEAWQRAGWPRGGAPRVPRWLARLEDEPSWARGTDHKLFRLGRRMRALGVPAAGVRPLRPDDPFGLVSAFAGVAQGGTEAAASLAGLRAVR